MNLKRREKRAAAAQEIEILYGGFPYAAGVTHALAHSGLRQKNYGLRRMFFFQNMKRYLYGNDEADRTVAYCAVKIRERGYENGGKKETGGESISAQL